MHRTKINSLQMLRAIAVALVIFIHVSNFVEIPDNTYNSPFSSFFYLSSWGGIGVDLFFAISGFIMTIVTPAYVDNGRWKDFLLKRAIRIIPIYYLISLFIFCINLRHTLPTNTAILKTIFFLPIFDKEKFEIPILHVGWSLSYEMYFYLLIALFLIFKGKLCRNLLFTILLLSSVGAVLNPNNVILKFITSPLLIEFAMGMGAGLIYRNINSIKWLNDKNICVALVATGAALMLISIFTGSKDVTTQEVIENNNYKALFRVIIWGIPAAIFLLGVVLLERTANFTTPKIFIKLGDASYSAYLIHVKLYQWYSKVFILTKLNGTIFILTAVFVCFIASIIFHDLIERPLTSSISKLISSKTLTGTHIDQKATSSESFRIK